MSGDAERLQAIEQSIAGERARSEDAGINLAHLKAGVTVTEGQWLLERLRAVESQRDQALAENERLRQRLQCAESLLDRLVSAAWEASKRDEHGVLLMDMVGDGYAMTAAINYLHPHDAEEATRQALEVVVGERHDA